ncbi:MAG: acyl carrier protein [Terracidiphilus sp.]|jgi:acyl carrier protein
MKTRTILFALMLIALSCAVVVLARAQTARPSAPARPQAGAGTQSPQARLKQYVADLQNNPDDTELRGKIIALAWTMKPPPAIPDEAHGHYVTAANFVVAANDNSGFEQAIGEYKATLLAAPWWADAYKKLAMVQKAADHYDEAIASLNLYLLTQPADAHDTQYEISKLKTLKQAEEATITEKVKKEIAFNFSVDEAKVTPGTRFKEDLGVNREDAASWVNMDALEVDLTSDFDLKISEIPNEDLAKFKTVQDVIDYIYKNERKPPRW